jgi:CHAT domain-containing protein/Tfp pilus assembly protein PilF
MNRLRALCITLLLLPSFAMADDRLKGVGDLLMSGQTAEARKNVLEARDAYVASGDTAGEATAWLLLGICDTSVNAIDAARGDLEKAAAKFEAAGDPFGGWLTLYTLAELEAGQGRFAESAALYERALAGLRAASDPKVRFSIETLKILGPVFGVNADVLGPIAAFPEIVKPVLLLFAEVMSRDAYGHVLIESGQLEKAEEQLQKAVSLSTPFAGMFDFSIAMHVGDLRRRQWRLDDSRDGYLKALAGMKSLPATPLHGSLIELEILRKLAELESLGGKLNDALAWNDRALKLVRELNDVRRSAALLEERGTLLQNAARFDDAVKAFNEALQIAVASDDRRRQAAIHSDLGALYMFDGSYGSAGKHLEKAIELYQALDDPYTEATVWTLLAEVDMLLDAHDNAADALEHARALAKKSGFKLAEAMVDMLSTSRNFMAGKAGPNDVNLAFKAWWDLPDAQSLMFSKDAQGVMSEILHAASSPTSRDVDLEQVRTAGPQFVRWTALMLKGKMALERGQPEAARKFWNEALNANPSRDHRAGLLGLIGASYWREGKPKEAIDYFTKAADALDASAADVKVEELLSGYLGSNRRWYFELLIDMLVQQGRYADAFAQAERARARAFLQLVGNHRLNPERGADPALVRETEMLRTQIARWEQQKVAARGADRQKIEADIQRAQQRFQTLLTRVKVSNPEYASVTNVEPLQLDAVRESLPAGTTMIDYFVSTHFVHAWVIDRNNMHYASLPLDRAKLDRIVCWATSFAPRGPRGAERSERLCDAVATPEEAFDGLIAPLRDSLDGATTLVLVPHGVLHYVPFAALRNRGTNRYLVQDYTLIHAPSASALRFLHAKSTPVQRRALVLGNPQTPIPLPPLPGAAAEANGVAQMFGTTAHLGADARESLLYHLDGKVDFVHLAAHGLYDADNPLFSRIALAPGDGEDGSLTVHEILSSLDLSGVKLVVLSACRSAAGTPSGGDEVVGLTRALLYAGTPNVISTLWNINDTASAGLMNALYRRLAAGASPAEALRQAQLSVLDSASFSSPKYWAAFTLSGDPRGWTADAAGDTKR